MSFVRPDSQPWRSDGSNPELHISLVSPTGVTLYMDQQNMQPSFLPLLWVASPNALKVEPGQWKVRFEDRTPSNQFTLMHEAALLITGPPTDRDAAGNGSYSYTAGSWSFMLKTNLQR